MTPVIFLYLFRGHTRHSSIYIMNHLPTFPFGFPGFNSASQRQNEDHEMEEARVSTLL